MKETTKTSRLAGYLEKIFRAINADSFAGKLEEPIITIQSTPTAYGHVTVSKVWKAKNEQRYELNIAADWLERPIENVVSTMIHEMTHLFNMQNGIQDCSRGGTYHNKKFKEEAEKHMIHIEKDDKYGWTITSPTDELLEYIMDKGWEDIDMGRGCLFGLFGGQDTGKPKKGTQTGTDGQEQPKKGNSRKYQCPSCKAIVRTTKDLHMQHAPELYSGGMLQQTINKAGCNLITHLHFHSNPMDILKIPFGSLVINTYIHI